MCVLTCYIFSKYTHTHIYIYIYICVCVCVHVYVCVGARVCVYVTSNTVLGNVISEHATHIMHITPKSFLRNKLEITGSR